MGPSRLELIIGPMFSGKSTEMLRRIRRLRTIGKRVLVVKPVIDNRYSGNKISTHDLETMDCMVSEHLHEVSDNDLSSHEAVVIDEGQFFADLYPCVKEWLRRFPITVIVAGLDGDFLRQPIGQILKLIPFSDRCDRLVALCSVCNDGTEAPFTARRNDSKHKILVGGTDHYFPVCRRHFNDCLVAS